MKMTCLKGCCSEVSYGRMVVSSSCQNAATLRFTRTPPRLRLVSCRRSVKTALLTFLPQKAWLAACISRSISLRRCSSLGVRKMQSGSCRRAANAHGSE